MQKFSRLYSSRLSLVRECMWTVLLNWRFVHVISDTFLLLFMDCIVYVITHLITELQLTLNAPPPSQMQAVRTKLSHLGPLYARSERFFPLEYLTLILEKYSCQRRWERGFVHQLFLEIGVSMTTLFTVYDKMFKAKVTRSNV